MKPLLQFDIIKSTVGSCCLDSKSKDCSDYRRISYIKHTISATLSKPGNYCEFDYAGTTVNDTQLVMKAMLADSDFRLLKEPNKPCCSNNFQETRNMYFSFLSYLACGLAVSGATLMYLVWGALSYEWKQNEANRRMMQNAKALDMTILV